MRSAPLYASRTRQEYDVYKLNTASASAEKHERMVKFYQKVVDEDFAPCEGVQRNLERGVWEKGPLHPFHEEGVRAFQGYVLGALKEHVEREEKVGRQIWAARPGSGASGVDDREGDVSGILSYCDKASGCEKLNGKDVDW